MFSTYYGELLISPLPIELSGNFCSHMCGYCFANLNQPNRKYDVLKTMRFLKEFKTRRSLTAKLLKNGYPVLYSNKIDPFSASNFMHSLPLIELMVQMNIKISIQTRGGHGIDEVLKILPKSVFYISITCSNLAIEQKIEPGAPPLPQRLALIDKLIKLGHYVVVGINPAVPEWMPDPLPLLVELKKLGVWGVWIERLHLNYKQIRNMTDKERANISEPILTRARKRYTHPKDFNHYKRVKYMANTIGLETFSVGQPDYSNFFYPYRVCYKNTFPIFQDFINLLHINKYDKHTPIFFNDLWEFMGHKFPKGEFKLHHYLGATSRDLFKKIDIPLNMSYQKLLKIIWKQPKTKYSLVKSPAFAYMSHYSHTKNKLIQLVDDEKLPILAYSKIGFKSYYTPF